MECLQLFLSQPRKGARNQGLLKKSRTNRFGKSLGLRHENRIIDENILSMLKKNRAIQSILFSLVKGPIETSEGNQQGPGRA
jgi:hypothetical protein